MHTTSRPFQGHTVDRPTLFSTTTDLQAGGHAVSLHVNGQHHERVLQVRVTLVRLP
jgi:hypothetical protein